MKKLAVVLIVAVLMGTGAAAWSADESMSSSMDAGMGVTPTNFNIDSVGTIALPRQGNGVCMVGNYVYVANGNAGGGLRIIDVSNPASPVQVGADTTLPSPWDVDVVGNYAYIADADSGLIILDVSNPASPHRVSKLFTNRITTLGGVTVEGEYAYLTLNNTGGLIIAKISDPTTPTQMGSYNWGTPLAYNVVVERTRAYVAAGTSGVQIINIANASHPTLLGTIPLAGMTVTHVASLNGIVFIAAWAQTQAELLVFNAIETNAPIPLASHTFSGDDITWIDLQNNFAVIGRGYNPITVLSVGDVINGSMIKSGWYSAANYVWGLVRNGDYIYATNGHSLVSLNAHRAVTPPFESK